jgi:hypothetical protein
MASFELAGHSFSFSGHETFVFRYPWLKKAADAVRHDPRVFTRDDAIVTLGVGKNMVRSIRHWGLATGVLEEEPKSRGTVLRVSQFGLFLFGDGSEPGADPYLEDPNSLWLIHWNLISNHERSTTWQWAFNRFPSNEFTREGLIQSITDECRRLNLQPPTDGTLRRDVEVFIRTYVSGRTTKTAAVEDSLDCPLTELGLMDEVMGTELYRIRRGPKNTISNEVFAHCLLKFWDATAPGVKSLAFGDIAYAQNSPGAIFKLDENSLVERLEHLQFATGGALGYAEGAGLKQVYRQQEAIESLSWLSSHYEETLPIGVGV